MSDFPFLNQDGISPLWIILSLSVITLSSLILFLNKPRQSPKTPPPSPPRLPIIGNLHLLGSHPHRSLRALAASHGPVIRLDLGLGSVPVVVVSSPGTAREVMKTHDLVLADRPASAISDRLLYNRRDIAAAPYGEYWRQMKGVSVVHLLNSKRVQSFRRVREEETAALVGRIPAGGAVVNLSEELATLTNDVVCRVALGRRRVGLARGGNFRDLLGEFVGLLGFNVGNYIPWLGWVNRVSGLSGRADRVFGEIDGFLDRVVQEHEELGMGDGENEERDFVDVLLRIKKENLGGFEIDHTSIKALILDVFSAGTDSTYTVLEWAMTELLKNPTIMKKLQTEVRQTANNKPQIASEDLENMPYLKAVIKETLRLHPPLPLLVPRISTQDVQINGYDIPKGTQVIINAWAIARDPASWDRPEEFWPERFLDSKIDVKGHDFQLLPFGAGRRACPGIHFAISIEELALASLVYKFDWSLPSGVKEEDLDMTESVGLTSHRKFPLFAVATPCSC